MKPVMCLTGGAGSLGREIVAYFEDKYQIIILDFDLKATSLMAKKFNCDFQICDITDYNSVDQAIEFIISNYHHIDCLINAAGIFIDGPIDQNDPDKIKKVIEVNSLGPINLCRAVIPHMKKQGSGTIININSTAGLHPKANNSVYHASKWALTGFTQSLQLELSDSNIKVVDIHPGDLNNKFNGPDYDLSHSIEPEEVAKTIEFILSLDKDIYIPELVIKHL